MNGSGGVAGVTAVVRQAGEGERLKVGAEELRYALTGEDTNGAFDLIERWVSPHFQSPPLPHTHTREDWMAYVLEGTLVFQIDGKDIELTPGASLFVPRGAYFRWLNPNPSAARMLCLYTPSGFGGFFREVFEEGSRKADRMHDYDKTLSGIMRLHDKYGINRKEPAPGAEAPAGKPAGNVTSPAGRTAAGNPRDRS